MNKSIDLRKIISKKKGNATYILYQYGQQYKADKKYAAPQRAHHWQGESGKARVYVSQIGAYAVIQKILEEYNLPQMLRNRFGSDTGLLMDLVSYLIVEEENAGQYYPDIVDNGELGVILLYFLFLVGDERIEECLSVIKEINDMADKYNYEYHYFPSDICIHDLDMSGLRISAQYYILDEYIRINWKKFKKHM